MAGVTKEEIKARAAHWQNGIEEAVQRLADAHLGPHPERRLDARDLAALAYVLMHVTA
jgi:hypothetical protein